MMDAIVIGAGIIGSSIAWRLAQRGLRVMLLGVGVKVVMIWMGDMKVN